MEKSLQSVQGVERVNIYGVRHLSPAASNQLLQLLDEVKPKCVLIEGPSDANSLMDGIVKEGVVLPVAMLAYTKELPVDTVMYPLAEYSPEYQAVRFAKAANIEVGFIDLPSGCMLSTRQRHADDGSEQEAKKTHAIYDAIAELDGALHFDDYFERNFEHNTSDGSFNRLMTLESSSLRQLLEPMEMTHAPKRLAANLIREAYMARQIQAALTEYEPEEVLVVTGAYHAERLRHTVPMNDEEVARLPSRPAELTLMPYSFYRLSSRAGYGAGNKAPAYFQLMWECMKKNRLGDLPNEYMSALGRHIRDMGGYCSTAGIIEAVRLARGLAYLKDGSQPTLEDLHAAAASCIGHGDISELATAFAMTDVGIAHGSLPEGVSKTPTQDDFYRELGRLKLDKYRTTVSTELILDLRENIRVKSKEAAFIDLNRSTFLHRLRLLGIGFAAWQSSKQDDASWREVWTLKWSPEAEVQVIEAVTKGETIELAAAYELKERLDSCNDVNEAAGLVDVAYICRLTGGVALGTLQKLAANVSDFTKAAFACSTLSQLLQYGDLRGFDKSPLIPLLSQLFLRAALLLVEYAGCDNKAAAAAQQAMRAMNLVSQENHEYVSEEAWLSELTDLSARDDKNPMLSGIAFAMLLERNLIDEDFCAKEVSRRLSPGIPADIGAGWFEGLAGLNKHSLLSRISLWEALDDYVQMLDEDEFRRAAVYMRRAFASFGPKAINEVAELLGQLWNVDSQEASIMLQAPLSDAETEALNALEDFDFDI